LKGKKISQALNELEEVTRMKRAVPMKGEVSHKKGIPSRYPVKAGKAFIKLLKSLEANASAKGMDLEIAKLSAYANKAAMQQKPGRHSGRKFKGTHVTILAKEAFRKENPAKKEAKKEIKKENEKVKESASH
jgi:ribosomal protein L22